MIDYKKISECDSIEYCQGWNEAMNEAVLNRFMPAECIGVSEIFKDRVTVGMKYLVDRYSIYMDHDGDVFGAVYNPESMKSPIGTMYLKNFKSI